MCKNLILSGCLAMAVLYQSCTEERTLYCDKTDILSIRIIPKRNPFKPVSDSIHLYTERIISCLEEAGPNADAVQHKIFIQLIAKLRTKTFFHLELLHNCFESFRNNPCDDNAYRSYRDNLTALQDHFAHVHALYSDIKKLAAKKDLAANNIPVIMKRVAEYLKATRQDDIIIQHSQNTARRY